MNAAPIPAPTFDCRVAFAEELVALARADSRIVAVCNDSVGSSNLVGFAKEFPDRMVNVGIAEQDMVGVAAGLANGGFVPFVSCAAPFLTGRALEQIKVDVAYSNYPVVLCGQSPGMSYGELGPTHHSIEDVAWMRAISNLTVVFPADPDETRGALRWAASAGKPVYIRIGRFKVPSVTPMGQAFEVGRASLLRAGDDVTLVATGTMVCRALEAAKELSLLGYEARVLNLATLKPLDSEALLRAARETGRLVTVEEAMVEGGMGSAIAALLAQ
jgi:transketolase